MTSYKYHHVSNQGRDTQLRVRMLHPSVDSPTHIRFVRLSSSCKDLVPLLHLSGSYQVKFVATVAHRSTITQSRLAHTETCIVSTTQLSKRLDQYHILSVDVFLQHPLCLARHYLTTLLPPLKSPHAIMSKPNSSLILPEIPIASQGFTYNALTTIKQVPASPARPATPHTHRPFHCARSRDLCQLHRARGISSLSSVSYPVSRRRFTNRSRKARGELPKPPLKSGWIWVRK